MSNSFRLLHSGVTLSVYRGSIGHGAAQLGAQWNRPNAVLRNARVLDAQSRFDLHGDSLACPHAINRLGPIAVQDASTVAGQTLPLAVTRGEAR